jgi:hypothetical protein
MVSAANPPRSIISVLSIYTLNKNEYQESLGVERGLHIRQTTSPPSVSRLSRTVDVSTSLNPTDRYGQFQGRGCPIWLAVPILIMPTAPYL